jgi:hypothetical protein
MTAVFLISVRMAAYFSTAKRIGLHRAFQNLKFVPSLTALVITRTVDGGGGTLKKPTGWVARVNVGENIKSASSLAVQCGVIKYSSPTPAKAPMTPFSTEKLAGAPQKAQTSDGLFENVN